MLSVHVHKQEEILGNDIFKRLEGISLIDIYKAYQLLDDQWDAIKVDLEIIQTEGFEATKIVDPNMVLKKKDGKDVEIQEGWKGRIMPFELVQETHLKEELLSIQKKENRLLEITATYEEVLETLSEEEKEEDTVNEAKEGFVNAEVIKQAKQIREDSKKNGAVQKESYEAKILKVDKLITEEKENKKHLKAEKDKLHLLTKATIEGLEEEQVFELLELKWINPVVTSLINLPKTMVDELTSTIQNLADKYDTTYSDVANQINEAENALSDLISDLDGNDFDMQGFNEFKNLLHG